VRWRGGPDSITLENYSDIEPLRDPAGKWKGCMKRLLGMILLAACLALPAKAQEPASPEALRAAQNLAAVMTGDSVQQMSGALINQMWPGLENQLQGQVDAAALTEMRGELERLLTKFVGEAMKDAPAIYARHFTVTEMGELVAFYKTSTGAKTLRELPKVTAESYALIAPRMAPFQQEVAASVEAIMQKHGYKK